MTLVEAMRLVHILAKDPSSALAAELAGWEHPVSREALVLMDLYDLEHMKAAGKKVDPHPARPGKHARQVQSLAMSTGGRTREEMIALLAGFGTKPT